MIISNQTAHLQPVNGVSEQEDVPRDCCYPRPKHGKQALDEGLIVRVLLIDFRKAFDTINHTILETEKLQGCGIAGQMFDILCDYLKDRTQYIELNGVKSKTRVIVYSYSTTGFTSWA